MSDKLLAGRRGLIMGVANDHSIAWGIAKAASDAGAELGFTYQGDAFKKRVTPLVDSIGGSFLHECDVTDTPSLTSLFDKVRDEWGQLDFVVHAIAYSDKSELKGRYVDTSAENFSQTMAISCYSFTEVSRLAAPLMTEGGSLLTLSFMGADRWMPSYNVMGVAKAALETSVRYIAVDLGKDNIRVNAISAGPMRTVSGAAVGDARYVLGWNRENSALMRNVSLDDMGGAAVYLLSDMSAGVTGEIHYVDAGYNVVGMKNPHNVRGHGAE